MLVKKWDANYRSWSARSTQSVLWMCIRTERHPSPGSTSAKEPDVHGNRLRRFIIPAGETTLLFSGLVRDDRLPDHRDAEALVTAVADLPDDVLVYLNGSRYCETDKLGALAWRTFGGMTRGTALVEVICDFTHHRLAFD